MKYLLAIIILTAGVSCKNRQIASPLDDIDTIQIHRKNSSIVDTITAQEGINIFKQVLKGEAKKYDQSYEIGCEVQGWIWFMSGNAVREMASFSNTVPDCAILVITKDQGDPFYSFKLTYRAGMYLENIMAKKRE